MKFANYEGPYHVEASDGRLPYFVVTAYCDAVKERIVVGEFPYEEGGTDSAVRKEIARLMAGRCATYDVPLRPRAWVKEGEDGQKEVSWTGSAPDGWADCSYPLHAARDNCEICYGTKGGVLGNENIIKGKVVCDYCHS